MMITTEGIIIRMPVAGISVLSRVTSGVKLMNLEPDVKVASLTKVREADTKDDEEDQTDDTITSVEQENNNAKVLEDSHQINDLLERAKKDKDSESN